MFGVILSGDTWEQVCVLQKRCLHEVNVKFIFFYDEAMSPVRADVRILHSKEVLGETCASWNGVTFWRGDDASMVLCLDEPILFRVP